MAPKRILGEPTGNSTLSKRPKKLSLSEGRIVIVGQGEEATSFHVQTCFLTKNSTFFQSACKEVWNQDNEDNTIKLPDHKSTAFEVWLQFACTDQMVPFSGDEEDELRKGNDVKRSYDRLLDIYILANYLGDSEACNDVMDHWLEIRRCVNMVPNYQTITKAYEALPMSSCLLQACCWQLQDFNPSSFEATVRAGRYPAELILEFSIQSQKLLAKGAKTTALEDLDRCAFHEHTGAKCGGS